MYIYLLILLIELFDVTSKRDLDFLWSLGIKETVTLSFIKLAKHTGIT